MNCDDYDDEPCVRLVIVKPIKMCATHAAAYSFNAERCSFYTIPTTKEAA